MSFGKPQAIAPDPAQAAGYSLLVAAGFIESDTIPTVDPEQSTPARWAGGVEWAPEQILGGGATSVDCLGRTAFADTEWGNALLDNPITNQAFPILVTAADRCSTFQSESRDRVGRARRGLAATQSFHIARELQHGFIRDAQSIDNVALVDGELVDTGSTDACAGFPEFEQFVSEQYGGRRAMFHVPPTILDVLAHCFVIQQSGQKWLTPMGNVVASDAGYGASEGVYEMYATLMPTVRLGEIITTPATIEEATDRSVNLVTFQAQRLTLVTFDNSRTDTADLIFRTATDTPVPTGS